MSDQIKNDDDTIFRLTEEADRYSSHAAACAANAASTKDGLLAQVNRHRSRLWSDRAAEVRARLLSLQKERGQ